MLVLFAYGSSGSSWQKTNTVILSATKDVFVYYTILVYYCSPMKEYTVYILRCVDSKLYIGLTSDIETRINEHNLGVHPTSFTYKRRPVRCVYTANFCDVYEAIAWERRIKRWSRAKKEALILGSTLNLEYLSRSQFRKRIDLYRNVTLYVIKRIMSHGSSGSP